MFLNSKMAQKANAIARLSLSSPSHRSVFNVQSQPPFDCTTKSLAVKHCLAQQSVTQYNAPCGFDSTCHPQPSLFFHFQSAIALALCVTTPSTFKELSNLPPVHYWHHCKVKSHPMPLHERDEPKFYAAAQRGVKVVVTREQAWQWVCEWVSNEHLRKHLLAVEAAMRHYARIYGEDEEMWGLAGLLHDIDYERHPEATEHPRVGAQFLRQSGVPEEVVEAILGHANWTGVARNSLMAKALYACDELTGLLVATALVMPNKKLSEVRVDSVLRKMKDKSFARKIDRQAIIDGANELGVPLEEHIANVLTAMQGIAEQLGL